MGVFDFLHEYHLYLIPLWTGLRFTVPSSYRVQPQKHGMGVMDILDIYTPIDGDKMDVYPIYRQSTL